MKTESIGQLRKSIRATFQHGVTGQPVEEVTLLPGTRYEIESREESPVPGLQGRILTTLLVHERGKLYRYTTWEVL